MEDDLFWWGRTSELALAVVAAAIALFFVPLFLAPLLDGASLLGFRPSYFLAALVAPIAVIGLVFWAAQRQDAIDRRHGMIED
jgi:putative solute:sodium symporter small subunit